MKSTSWEAFVVGGFCLALSVAGCGEAPDCPAPVEDTGDACEVDLSGDDVIEGTNAGDTLFGGEGDDLVKGFEGDDTLVGGDGADDLRGGLGYDTLVGGPGADTLTGGEDDDTLFGGRGSDNLTGSAGTDRLYGGLGDDILDGGDGVDSLYGEEGTDILSGGAGDDSLFGGDGLDTLDGGAGDDDLMGGAGSDRFVLGDCDGVDQIMDFDPGEDFLVAPTGVAVIQVDLIGETGGSVIRIDDATGGCEVGFLVGVDASDVPQSRIVTD